MAKQNLIKMHLRMGESKLNIWARKDIKKQAGEILKYLRQVLIDHIKKDPGFEITFSGYEVPPEVHPMLREMASFGRIFNIGPMAAVAGAIAEYLGKELLKFSQEVIVENGGDIFLSLRKPMPIKLFSGQKSVFNQLALTVLPRQMPLGIGTSSGKMGRSTSLGKADAVTIVARSAILADAAATFFGNQIHGQEDVGSAFALLKKFPELLGMIVVVGASLFVAGDITLHKN